jgi:hypothetical protein
MLLEGFAVIFAGLDRESENFAPGCLARACKAFLEGSALPSKVKCVRSIPPFSPEARHSLFANPGELSPCLQSLPDERKQIC